MKRWKERTEGGGGRSGGGGGRGFSSRSDRCDCYCGYTHKQPSWVICSAMYKHKDTSAHLYLIISHREHTSQGREPAADIKPCIHTHCVCVYTCLCLLGISPANDLNSLKLLVVMWVTLATTARHGHAFAGSLMPFSRLTQELFLQLVVSHGGETKTKTDILHISKALS